MPHDSPRTMPRRNLIPLAVIGLLGLLAAGAAILAGAFQAPSTVDLVVHNAAGETLGASTITGTYRGTTLSGDTLHFHFEAPDRLTVFYSGPAKGISHTPQTATGPTARNVLSPVQQLEQLHGFTVRGSTYVFTESVKQLVPAGQRSKVHGTVQALTTVKTGYVVRVQEHVAGVDARSGHAQRITRHMDYRLSRVDGWTST